MRIDSKVLEELHNVEKPSFVDSVTFRIKPDSDVIAKLNITQYTQEDTLKNGINKYLSSLTKHVADCTVIADVQMCFTIHMDNEESTDSPTF